MTADLVQATGPTGYSLPLSPSGRSATLTPPPWHFAGEVIMVDYRVDPGAAAAFLPPGLDPGDDPGAAAAVFAQWQWCSAAGDELADPLQSRFGEFLILLGCAHRGRPLARCAYAWVDQPVPMIRGWVQGMPKQLGVMQQTMPLRVGRAGPRFGSAGTYAGTASAQGHRVAAMSVTVTDEVSEPPLLHTVPLVHTRVFPAWLPGEQQLSQLVTSKVTDVTFSDIWTGPAELEIFDGLGEDLASLRPIEVGPGHVFGYAETLCHGEALATDGETA